MAQTWSGPIEKIDAWRYRIPASYKAGMKVPGLIYASEDLIGQITHDNALEQVANVATLPGLVGQSLAMPDIHWGYGFCIGGVAATDPAEGGVVSPGGVGYDINCGVRLIKTSLQADGVKGQIDKLIHELFRTVPAGVGKGGKYKCDSRQLNKIMVEGVRFIVADGLGWESDIDYCEEGGAIAGADPDAVSDRAHKRGADQCGTLGSGNHFIELQEVVEIFDEATAEVMGLSAGQLVVMIHSGSRGLGYQVCDDAIRDLRDVPRQYGIELPDRQLVCVPPRSMPIPASLMRITRQASRLRKARRAPRTWAQTELAIT